MTQFMRNSDAFTWNMESDPLLRSTVVTVILLDRSPDWDEVRRRFELISNAVPSCVAVAMRTPAMITRPLPLTPFTRSTLCPCAPRKSSARSYVFCSKPER